MKKIISILLIGMMTAGCGKTARLERLERKRAEIAAEQERVNKLCKQVPVDKKEFDKEVDKEIEELFVDEEVKQSTKKANAV